MIFQALLRSTWVMLKAAFSPVRTISLF